MSKKEVIDFNADIQQLMGLIVNSFYSNKDIFLRELISNSSDALDKIRHKHLSNGTTSEYKIDLETDKENKILSISDTGVGMTKEELQQNLGTIAHSGTKQFMEALESGTGDMSMIGQFGVGFYSGYLVADKVQVVSKSEDDDKCHVWESSAGGSYTISECDGRDTRGTTIKLHLKSDQEQYLEEHTLKNIIKKHSQYVGYPISLLVEKTKEEEVTDDEVEESLENKDEVENSDEVKVEDVDEEKEKKTKKIQKHYTEWENVNPDKPIWTRNQSDVTEEEYKSFYKNLTNDYDDYAVKKHFSVEGSLEFKGILFIPKRKPFDIFDPNKKRNNIKLHVRKVFISDNCEELVPEWLSFVKGLVDSEDLPLNVSREMLQENKIIKVMKKNIIKKSFEMIEELAENPEEYKEFHNNYSKNIKLGIYEDSGNRDKLASFLRYYTSKSGDDMRSLDDYIKDMDEKQTDIYYITGESKESVDLSPFVEKLKKEGKEVLYMTEAIDEYSLQQLKEYNGKKLVSITKENLQLDEENTEDSKNYEELCKAIKDSLGDKVEKVKLGSRIVDSPCCLVTSEFGWSANMERLMKAQALGDDQQKAFMVSKKTMEINKDHKIIKELKNRFEKDKNDKTINDLVGLIYDVSLIRSGFSLENTKNFSSRIYRIVELGLGLDEDTDDTENIEEVVQDDNIDESQMEQVD